MQYRFGPDELRAGVRGDRCGLTHLSCQRLELDQSCGELVVESGTEECVLVCIEGQVEYECGDNGGSVQTRDMLYVPRGSRVKLAASSKAVVMRIGADSDRDTEFSHIRFESVRMNPEQHKVYGSEETSSVRDVYMYIDDKFNASRLLVGIGEGRAGNWTVWPPHEHGDEKEELYVYFDMGRAFGIQCVYESLEEPLFCGIVRDGDMVAVPRGFHPNVGCPGGRICYIYAMAARVAGQRDFMALRFQEGFGDSF